MKSLALLHKIFEGQVERAPNNIALIIGNKAINYNELNEKSNQLANLIRARININVGNYIALCLDRDEWMIIAILAVLKAGGTYVPIDPNYPAERIKYILSETDSQLILTNSRCVKILREFKSNILNLDNESSHINSYCRNNLIDIYTNNNDPLSYVVFTSGTTGKPKGVMVQHSGVVNLVTQSFSHYNINYKDQPCSFLFFSNYVFDVHAWEIFSCLLFGNKLYLAQDIIRYDLQLLSDFIEENNITYGLVTPAILNTKNLLKFNTLLVAGDRISQNIIEYYLKNNITIINAYGPTEASILSSMHMYKHHDLPNNIGKPIANIQYYVLNEDGQQVFIGESGELYISGKGVASGYLNQPELTNKIFVNNPFQINGNKIYKTGDIVRVMENGEYEFIGRNDSQIKLRGYRIELGEIESAINQYPEVSQSIVQLSQSGYTSSSAEKFIVGYYVANKPIPYGKLINHLEKILPVYMLPTALVHLEKLPLNHNGKVDKCSLPQPSLSDEKSHKTASSEIETTITLLWSKILNIPTKEISTNQKFYRLGGNSILAVSLLSQLNDKFHCNLNIIDIFNYSTIEELAKSIEAKASITKAKQVLNNDIYDGITASELIILRDYYHTEYKNIYNESFVVEFDGLINERTIRESLLMLVNNYEILRVNYINEDGKFTRTLRNSVDLSFLYHDFSDKNISENTFELIISKEVSREFNIENGSLIRFYFYHMGNKKSRLLIVFFHAILDGTSIINILLPDLAIKLFSENQSKLKLATNSLLDFDKVGSRLELYYSSVEAESLRYWKYFFNKYEPCKINNKIGDEKNSIGKQLTFKINADIKQRLISVANHEDISLFDVLLGAFYILLMKFCNQKSIAIRTNIDERIYCPEYLNVPGCLINNIFIGISIEKDWCIRDLLQAVKEEKSIALSHPVKFNSLLKDFRDNVIALSGVHFNIEPETNSNLPYKQSQIYTHSGQVKNNLYFELDVKPDEILGRVEFKTTLFSEDFIDSLIKSYNTILINIENQLFCKVDDACLVSVEKFKYTVNDHKNMNFSPLSDASIIKIFEDQCNKFPNRVAVDCAGRKLSYSELNVLSNQLAHYLRNHCEVQTEELVGL
ncbi:MAG: hypothetical protein K0R94_1326, partial [Burkholderiales bacterium]|nr:hypothetical protein [Burkholderiales bacterium]